MNKHVAFVLCVFISLQVNAQNTYNEEDFDVLYKNALQYMAQEQYENAAWNWEELEKIEKSSHAPLYQGQTYYHLGRYNEAVAKLTEYLNQSGEVYSEEALYWIGECLFAMGQFDKAKLIFLNFMKDYAQSIKAEKVKYRLDLIEHKKILDELLELLHWSHEESLRAVNSYQKQERFYEQTINNLQQTINGLQKQISDLKKEIALFDFDKINDSYQSQIEEYEKRIAALEAQIKESGKNNVVQSTPAQKMERLLSLKNAVQDLQLGGSQ